MGSLLELSLRVYNTKTRMLSLASPFDNLKSSASFTSDGTMLAEQPLSVAFHFDIPSWISGAGKEDDDQSAEIATCLPCSLCVLCNSMAVSTRPCCVGECTVAYRIQATATA